MEDAKQKILTTFQDKKIVFKENGADVYSLTLKDLGYSLDENDLTTQLTELQKKREADRKIFAEQENVNIRRQTEQLRWKLNCNFQAGDMFITFSYRKDERPDTYKEMLKQKDKLIRDLRKQYKKIGKEFKYVYVLETGDKGARHIHMVIENIDTKAIKKCWDRGRIHIRLLDDTGQYGKLASYLVKEKGRKKMEKYGGKTYSPI